jgi:exonuclease III
MAETYKIATLNVNGMSSGMRIKMLEDFLHKQEIDILLLQLVTQHDFDVNRGYNAYIKVGTQRRGTAMLTRE